ncbi:PREDICTED: lupus La protein-like [Priapulus caudatus]|uniref:Lupus La protein-like n=1 Tax=Priapulus caudatus TaxID=37621 RepID=A0ABM1FC16_PRICU|nr:PREDICTED: lupus La protein-like [Priapulus caudatus]XP_014681986.1 PREDICTED: lupus La protein-like [Priapulus caudatus]XP_014681987.1 PREDICTED: lupus La protein-like [Priapulus caudatus]
MTDVKEEQQNGGDGDKLEEPTELEQKIIRQIEYYFGDSNLSRDRFLQEQIKLDDGWIPLDTMVKFNRLKAISEDISLYASAMKKAKRQLVEVSEDCLKIRRFPSKPLPENTEERRADIKARNIYAKGFPLDMSLDDVVVFLEKYGPVESVAMRRTIERKFKGSIFALFETKEAAKSFLECTEKFNENELLRLSKEGYFNKKNAEKSKMKTKPAGDKKEPDNDFSGIQDKIEFGMILHLTGFAAESTREHIKELLTPHGTVAWVDFSKGDSEAWVRFTGDHKAQEVLEKVTTAGEGKLIVNDSELQGSVLEGDEETTHWKQILAKQAEGRDRKRQRGRGRRDQGRGGRGGRGGYYRRDGRGHRDDWGSQNKKTKFADGAEDESKKVEGDTEKKSPEPDTAKRPAGEEATAEEPPSKQIKTDSSAAEVKTE